MKRYNSVLNIFVHWCQLVKMEIRELIIFSHKINEQDDFYRNVLEFRCSRVTNSILEIHTGDTKLILEKSTKKFFYHFAFLIPTGTLNAAIDYLEKNSIQLLLLNGEKVIQFNSGRAIYFYDKDGNIAEFIERPTLNNQSGSDFSIESIIKLNEIGLPVSEPKNMTRILTTEFGIKPIKNAPFTDRFCWVGDYNGAVIVIKEGRNWLPTEKPGIINDFSIKYMDQGKEYNLTFANNEITNSSNTPKLH